MCQYYPCPMLWSMTNIFSFGNVNIGYTVLGVAWDRKVNKMYTYVHVQQQNFRL